MKVWADNPIHRTSISLPPFAAPTTLLVNSAQISSSISYRESKLTVIDGGIPERGGGDDCERQQA